MSLDTGPFFRYKGFTLFLISCLWDLILAHISALISDHISAHILDHTLVLISDHTSGLILVLIELSREWRETRTRAKKPAKQARSEGQRNKNLSQIFMELSVSPLEELNTPIRLL